MWNKCIFSQLQIKYRLVPLSSSSSLSFLLSTFECIPYAVVVSALGQHRSHGSYGRLQRGQRLLRRRPKMTPVYVVQLHEARWVLQIFACRIQIMCRQMRLVCIHSLSQITCSPYRAWPGMPHITSHTNTLRSLHIDIVYCVYLCPYRPIGIVELI